LDPTPTSKVLMMAPCAGATDMMNDEKPTTSVRTLTSERDRDINFLAVRITCCAQGPGVSEPTSGLSWSTRLALNGTSTNAHGDAITADLHRIPPTQGALTNDR